MTIEFSRSGDSIVLRCAPARGYEKGEWKTKREEKQGRKHNLLTSRLLEAGYTVDSHPDYVKVDVPFAQKKEP